MTADVSLVRLWQSVILRASGASWIPDIPSCFLCGNHPNGEICAVEEGGLVFVSKQDLIDNWEWVRHLSGLLASYWFYCMDFSLKCFRKDPRTGKLFFTIPRKSAISCGVHQVEQEVGTKPGALSPEASVVHLAWYRINLSDEEQKLDSYLGRVVSFDLADKTTCLINDGSMYF